MTRWIEPVDHPNATPLPDLHALVGQTLIKRGFTQPKSAQAFLDPKLYRPAPPTDLPGLSNAADRIIESLQAHDPICVWGDFDVDGQTSTTVLVQSLTALGADVSYHIPVRQYESHGVNNENLARIIAQGAKLVITCDTGIGALAEVEYARSRGVDMIITDHHDLPPELPKAAALVNPKMLPAMHPLASLAGVGVAYKLAEELIARCQPASFQAESLLDLVAMGLVADLAILRGDARYLVQKGLEQLRNTERLGLKTIMGLAELTAKHLTEEHIGFALGPRLNALGRLGDANPAVELLTTSDPIRARVLAAQLEGLNIQRKLLCDQVTQAAEAQLRANPELLTQAVIVLAHPLWPAGIVGIVASRIVERYHKPAILLTAPEGQPARGSARSIEGLNITAAIAAQKDILLGFGGHPMAAGLSLEAEKLPEFRRRLAKTVEEILGDTQEQEGMLEIDGWLNLEDANLELAEQIEQLAPFGPGNVKLTLASRNLTIKSSTKLGKNKDHLKLTVSDENGNTSQVLWWDGGSEEAPTGKFDLAYSLRASDWRGVRQAQLEFVDFRLLEVELLEISSKNLEVLDLREIKNPIERLKIEIQEPGVICWAEAEDKKRINGIGRNELSPAKTLIIWTTPPSRRELLMAMEKVSPEKVVVFAIDPGMKEPKAVLERLAGLVKFTLNKKAGETSLAELAVATAQKESTVKLGLDCLSKQGQITVKYQTDGRLVITPGGIIDTEAAELAASQFGFNFEESQAYRKLFQQQANIILE
jgi:single-stranded-DNA-specific exonuclease